MDKISPVLERHLNNMSLSDLYKAQQEQYAEVGYYFHVLCQQRYTLQYIQTVINRKRNRIEKFREAGEKRRKDE